MKEQNANHPLKRLGRFKEIPVFVLIVASIFLVLYGYSTLALISIILSVIYLLWVVLTTGMGYKKKVGLPIGIPIPYKATFWIVGIAGIIVLLFGIAFLNLTACIIGIFLLLCVIAKKRFDKRKSP